MKKTRTTPPRLMCKWRVQQTRPTSTRIRTREAKSRAKLTTTFAKLSQSQRRNRRVSRTFSKDFSAAAGRSRNAKPPRHHHGVTHELAITDTGTAVAVARADRATV